MKHPRRSEVFRDVGSAFHEPDDPDFIELIEAAFEPDAAFLLCSDGLSDMVPSAVIERIVRAHAGDPDRIVKTLIDEANHAGGKDNVTVVYAEGPEFAAASATSNLTTHPRGATTSLLATRVAWLSIGVVAGLLGGLLLSDWVSLDSIIHLRGPRTLVVGPPAVGQYRTIAAAVAASRSGDVISLEPGEYPERVVLKDGVDLVARLSGTATVVAPSGDLGWTTITVNGRLGNRISGLRLLGRRDAPLAVALQLSGRDVVVDDVTIEGDVLVGVEVAAAGTITVHSSRFADVQGVPIRLGPGAQPSIRHNVFLRKGAADSDVAIDVADSAAPELIANLFVGYPNAVRWAQAGTDVHRDNFFMRGGHGR